MAVTDPVVGERFIQSKWPMRSGSEKIPASRDQLKPRARMLNSNTQFRSSCRFSRCFMDAALRFSQFGLEPGCLGS